jgi:hypothetical protein
MMNVSFVNLLVWNLVLLTNENPWKFFGAALPPGNGFSKFRFKFLLAVWSLSFEIDLGCSHNRNHPGSTCPNLIEMEQTYFPEAISDPHTCF